MTAAQRPPETGQRSLLRQEGIVLNEAQRVDLASRRWDPPADWLARRGLLA